MAVIKDTLDIFKHWKAGGGTLADFRAQHPDLDAATLEKLILIDQLYEAGRHVQPSARFRRQSPGRLQKRLEQSRRPPAARETGVKWLPVRRIMLPAAAAILLVFLTLLLTGPGVTYADSRVPGERLYWADHQLEGWALQRTASVNEALGLRTRFAEERLQEAEVLEVRGDFPHVEEALGYYEVLADEIVATLDSGEVTDEAVLQMTEATFSTHEARLQTILDTAPDAARPGLARAIEASQKNRDKITGKPEDTPGNGPPDANGEKDTGKPEDTPGNGPPDDRDKGKGKSDQAPGQLEDGDNKPQATPGGNVPGDNFKGKSDDNPGGGNDDKKDKNTDEGSEVTPPDEGGTAEVPPPPPPSDPRPPDAGDQGQTTQVEKPPTGGDIPPPSNPPPPDAGDQDQTGNTDDKTGQKEQSEDKDKDKD